MIRTSESIAAISPAFIAFQAEVPAVPKATKGQVGSAVRFYSDLATVIETAQPVLAAHGLGYMQSPSSGNGEVNVTTRILHISGEWFEDTLGMPAERANAQAVGSAISYAKRYALVAMLGLASEDNDGATANPKPAQQTRTAPKGKATEAQITRLVIAFNEFGVKQRDERLRYLSKVADREITSSKDLTTAEAARAIDAIETAVRMDAEKQS